MEVDLPEKEENPHVCRWVWPLPVAFVCCCIQGFVLLHVCVRACAS